eukprot:m.30009 g.30009  ORF g.30009 m.30009 type:complete len:83 (-) comp8162_c0_seq2:763-1011(-)
MMASDGTFGDGYDYGDEENFSTENKDSFQEYELGDMGQMGDDIQDQENVLYPKLIWLSSMYYSCFRVTQPTKSHGSPLPATL